MLLPGAYIAILRIGSLLPPMLAGRHQKARSDCRHSRDLSRIPQGVVGAFSLRDLLLGFSRHCRRCGGYRLSSRPENITGTPQTIRLVTSKKPSHLRYPPIPIRGTSSISWSPDGSKTSVPPRLREIPDARHSHPPLSARIDYDNEHRCAEHEHDPVPLFRDHPCLSVATPARQSHPKNLRALRDFVLNPLRAILPVPLFRDHPCHSVATPARQSHPKNLRALRSFVVNPHT
jgi:hypothetical protein